MGALLFLLFVLSWRFSLIHQIPLAPMIPFISYFFMIIGLPPTILLILFTSIFCTTSYPNDIVAYTCLEKPFALDASSGFVGYAIASGIAAGLFYYLVMRKQK